RDLVVEEVCVLALGRIRLQMFGARVRRDPVAPVTADTVAVDKAHRGHAEVALSGEARRRGLGRLRERECAWMTGEEFLERRRLGRIVRRSGAQEFQKLLTGSGGEAVARMADDIGMHAFAEMEPD